MVCALGLFSCGDNGASWIRGLLMWSKLVRSMGLLAASYLTILAFCEIDTLAVFAKRPQCLGLGFNAVRLVLVVDWQGLIVSEGVRWGSQQCLRRHLGTVESGAPIAGVIT